MTAVFNTLDISIPAPARGATAVQATNNETVVFQFPPLREGRPHTVTRRY